MIARACSSCEQVEHKLNVLAEAFDLIVDVVEAVTPASTSRRMPDSHHRDVWFVVRIPLRVEMAR